MKRHKENIFANKFHMLNSQESEVINWSSSESSDFENVSSNAAKVCNFSKKTSRKRKRKQIVHKNISNLDITVIDVTKDCKDAFRTKETNIYIEKPERVDTVSRSPILGSSQYFMPYKCGNAPDSPILSSKTIASQSRGDKSLKSPILVLKTASPKVSPNVRKKLFKMDTRCDIVTKDVNSNCNSKMINQNYCLDRRKSDQESKNCKFSTKKKEYLETNDKSRREDIKNHIPSYCEELNRKSPILSTTFIIKEETKSPDEPKSIKMEIADSSQEIKSDEICIIEETPETNKDSSMAMLKTSSADLANRVKNYFENQFSSEGPSQQTISEVSTQKDSSKTSEDIEIINIQTQMLTNKNSIESLKEFDSFANVDKKEKKIRYKKDGLAYRLNNLLKKQTASISLWQHERFLAENSNFVIPKGEFVAFRVSKVNFKYGCHLLEAMDLSDDNYLILINSCHYNDNILADCIIKLYEPYSTVDFKHNWKLIINVTKFECVTIKN